MVLSCSGLYCVLMLCLGCDSAVGAVYATGETYDTPYMAAKVFASLPEEQQGAIYLNDLGLIAARTNVKVIDVCGLGDPDTFNLIRSEKRTEEEMVGVLAKRGARYAAVFSGRWAERVLSNKLGLKPVATLTGAQQNMWIGGDLSFYAFNRQDEQFFAEHIANMSSMLPSGLQFCIRPDLQEK